MKAKFNKMVPIEGGFGSCMCCGYQHSILPVNGIISVGFGTAQLTKNGEIIYQEVDPDSQSMTFKEAEKLAAEEPDDDWRIILDAPLSGRSYQRQGAKHWVLFEKNEGFA